MFIFNNQYIKKYIPIQKFSGQRYKKK